MIIPVKITKEESNYEEKSPEFNCKDCSMFRDGKCTLVEGDINPLGTCDYWHPQS